MPIKNIEKFVTDRELQNVKPSRLNYATNIVEELLEMYGVNIDKQARPNLKKRVNDFILNELKLQGISFNLKVSDEDIIDAITDIRVFSINETMKMDYDPTLTLDEVGKEVNSRQGEVIDNKFQKFTTPEAKAKWYKADFTKTRRVS